MASDCGQRRKPLYADLFKNTNLGLPEKGGGRRRQQNNTAEVSWNSSSSGSSSWTQSLLSGDSSSSGLSTPINSELGSSGSEDVDFIGELSRQMAECMLQEDDEQGQQQEQFNNELRGDDSVMPPIQVCEVKNQPKTGRRRRVRGKPSESTRLQKQQQQQNYSQFGGYGVAGSGMQAVYLGGYGSGSGSGSVGTGVFLPRVSREPEAVSREPVQLRKKKSGYPMVLIPTRVLQVLEDHFSRIQDSNLPTDESSRRDGPDDDDDDDNGGEDSHEEEKISENNEGMMAQLPKEWTY